MNKNLRIAIDASIDAGNEIMKVYESDFDVELKSDDSPLTLADKNANEVINSYLIKTGIPIISEENAQTDYEIRKEWTTCWIVDPLDGTKEFVKRNGEFTVNIALVKNGKPVLGVIYVPFTKKLYFADALKKAAYSYQMPSKDVSIEHILESAKKIKDFKEEDAIIKVVGSRSHMNQETTDYVDNLKLKFDKVEVVSKGSSLKFCLVAEGLADVYPRFAPTMEWDTAAAHAICKAVGVSVARTDADEELMYNKENLLNPWFIVKRSNFD